MRRSKQWTQMHIDFAASTGWITVSEAAEMLGVSRQRVDQLIGEGRLAAARAGYVRMVRESAVQALIEERLRGKEV